MSQNAPIILASGSKYRAEQLKQLGLAFTQQARNIDESRLADESADTLALRLAKSKALDVDADDNTIVIGCDQTASFGDMILGKPGTAANAIDQLSKFSANEVIFNSALCVKRGERLLLSNTLTRVKFKTLNKQQISTYIEREQPLDCAGSFKSEGLGICLFEWIKSDDPSALIGLPLIALGKALQELGLDPILS